MGVRDAALRDSDATERVYRCRSLAEAEQHVQSLTVRTHQLEQRVRYMEDLFDTFLNSPVWKRFVFWAGGWPMSEIGARRRPWYRWL